MESIVAWVNNSVTYAGVGFRASTQPTQVLYLIGPTYLTNPDSSTVALGRLVLVGPDFFRIDINGVARHSLRVGLADIV